MVKQHVKQLIATCPLSVIDTEKLWAAVKDVPFVWVENVQEILAYEPLASGVYVKSTHVLVVQSEDYISIVALLNPEEAGLSGLVSSQLGYVPKLIMIEWAVSSDSAGWREVVVCVGHHLFDEPFLEAKVEAVTIDGSPVADEDREVLRTQPQASRISLFATYAALRQRAMLIDRQLSVDDYLIRVMTPGHYGIQ
jgi:hypothetical protein